MTKKKKTDQCHKQSKNNKLDFIKIKNVLQGHNSIIKKDSPPNKKGQRAVFQRRYTDGQEAREKLFNIINLLGNANQNH